MPYEILKGSQSNTRTHTHTCTHMKKLTQVVSIPWQQRSSSRIWVVQSSAAVSRTLATSGTHRPPPPSRVKATNNNLLNLKSKYVEVEAEAAHSSSAPTIASTEICHCKRYKCKKPLERYTHMCMCVCTRSSERAIFMIYYNYEGVW